MLLDLRSALNVGAIFRTADAVGVSKIYCVGTTPTPRDRFGRARNDIAKAALGAEQDVPWEYFKTAATPIRKMRQAGVTLCALEQDAEAIDYKKVKSEGDLCLVVGNEVTGVPRAVLGNVDVVAEIPMRGKKESLNVATATGIALYRILGM